MTLEDKLSRGGHQGGAKCRCAECLRLKATQDKWIGRLGSFYGSGGLKEIYQCSGIFTEKVDFGLLRQPLVIFLLKNVSIPSGSTFGTLTNTPVCSNSHFNCSNLQSTVQYLTLQCAEPRWFWTSWPSHIMSCCLRKDQSQLVYASSWRLCYNWVLHIGVLVTAHRSASYCTLECELLEPELFR